MTGRAFADELERYGAMARRAVHSYVPADGFSEYLRAPAAEYLGRAGKGLRPALCLATCEAFGGTPEQALPSAAALELLHTAFLVHDDVEDDSELRRGEATLHQQYGRALAVNAGDGLAVLALGALRDNEGPLGRRLAARIWSEFDFMARLTVDGQARELGWQRDGRTDLTPDDYLDLIMRKTCWYTTLLPLRVGALIGAAATPGRQPDLDALLRFGFFLGAAFQIRDDILNLIGSPALYGKELLGDLREGKRTLMLIHLLAAAGPRDRASVAEYLALEPAQRSGEVADRMLAMMLGHGSVAFADEFARGIARSAAAAFEEAFAGVPDSPARRFVRDLVPYMVDRDR
ncbi:MAG TPA: polyprenyl synthetase family protein [Mycobacteriales bacterium]|nr:polyprenyl synthetase family protein [Mycobacteriales bacterium]